MTGVYYLFVLDFIIIKGSILSIIFDVFTFNSKLYIFNFPEIPLFPNL